MIRSGADAEDNGWLTGLLMQQFHGMANVVCRGLAVRAAEFAGCRCTVTYAGAVDAKRRNALGRQPARQIHGDARVTSARIGTGIDQQDRWCVTLLVRT